MNYLRNGFLDNWFVVDGCFGQPEGPPEEWRQIIQAMKERKHCRAGRRLAVTDRRVGMAIYSPRNTTGPDDEVLILEAEIDGWIAAAEQLLSASSAPVKL